MLRFRCNNPACGSFPRGFEFEDRGGECPKCGAKGPPGVAALVDVHLMVMDPKGPITGRYGRQHVACQPQRPYLCRHPGEMFAATDDPRAVTCPKCIRGPEFRAAAAEYADEMAETLGGLPTLTTTTTTTVDLGGKN